MLSASSYAHVASSALPCKPSFQRSSAPFFLLVVGSVPHLEAFLSTPGCAELNTPERRGGDRLWDQVTRSEQRLPGEQFTSAASLWPGRKTICWDIICQDIFAQLQVSWDLSLEIAAVYFSFSSLELSMGGLSTWSPKRTSDRETKPLYRVCTSSVLSCTYYCFSHLVSKRLL